MLCGLINKAASTTSSLMLYLAYQDRVESELLKSMTWLIYNKHIGHSIKDNYHVNTWMKSLLKASVGVVIRVHSCISTMRMVCLHLGTRSWGIVHSTSTLNLLQKLLARMLLYWLSIWACLWWSLELDRQLILMLRSPHEYAGMISYLVLCRRDCVLTE
jgi:hypothetical protein